MSDLPQNKDELLKGITGEWRLLLDVAGSLSDEELHTLDLGGWSPKDNLAHLAVWMNVLMDYHMDHRPAEQVLGISEELARAWDMDRINAVLLERNKDLSRQEVMDSLQITYKKLMSRLQSTPFEVLLEPRFADDPGQGPLLSWVLWNTTDHFREHRQNIQRALIKS